jgi:uncharacterized protein
VEIAVVTVRSLNGQSIEDYTKGLAREWGVGTHGKNNGIVFLVALSERKIRIETASGARAILTVVLMRFGTKTSCPASNPVIWPAELSTARMP